MPKGLIAAPLLAPSVLAEGAHEDRVPLFRKHIQLARPAGHAPGTSDVLPDYRRHVTPSVRVLLPESQSLLPRGRVLLLDRRWLREQRHLRHSYLTRGLAFLKQVLEEKILRPVGELRQLPPELSGLVLVV